MAARELVVLGTSSQAPTRTRNHNGYVLRWDSTTLMFDPGEGTQRQMVLAGVASPRIERICVTHSHNDHCLGVPGVLARMALDAPGRRVALHGPDAALGHLGDLVRVAQADVDVELSAVRPGAEPLDVAGAALRGVALDHRVPAVGYRLDEPARPHLLRDRLAAAGIVGPDVGRLQREGELRGVKLAEVSVTRPGQSFAFVMDTRLCPGVEELLRGVDLAVVESTFLDRDARLAQDYAHLTARQAATAAARAGVRRLVLTHYSQRYGNLEEIAAEARSAVREAGGSTEVHVAADLDVIAVPARRETT
ncbi:ribonuclease Z [Kineococcus gynurae]|uniref:Ribonuclease Z n=1 Tax=Kineococcus gynurae TaxID=452979 RepID=A0ABV5LQ05_9ACTN